MSVTAHYFGGTETGANASIVKLSGTKAEIMAEKPPCIALGEPSDSAYPLMRTPGGDWQEFSTGAGA